MTDYKGPNAFSNGVFKPAKAPTIIPPYQRSPGGVVRKTDGPAFNNRFPKSRYRGGGQSEPNIVSGGGGGGYAAKAVHFNEGTAWLQRGAPLTGVSNTSKFLMSLWAANIDPGYSSYFAATYPNNDFFQQFITDGSGGGVFFSLLYNQVENLHIVPKSNFDFIAAGAVWSNLLVSVDTANADPDKQVQVLANGSNSTDYTPGSIAGFDINVPESDFFFGTDGYAPGDPAVDGDFADFQLWFGIAPDLTNSTNVEAFIIDGKPVNPSVAAALFGTQTVLFSGDADTFGTNQGTGGPFTLTGALTNATTSPSDA